MTNTPRIALITLIVLARVTLSNSQSIQYDYTFDLSTPLFEVENVGGVPGYAAFDINGDPFSQGRRLFVLSGSQVSQINLRKPFDITTVSGETSRVFTENAQYRGIAFNRDGTRMFLLNNDVKAIEEYILSPAFNLGSATLTGTYDFFKDESNIFGGLGFSEAGDHLFLGTVDNRLVIQYELAGSFDLAGKAVLVGDMTSATEGAPGVTDFKFNRTGSKLLIASFTTRVYTYELDEPFQVTSVSGAPVEHNFLDFGIAPRNIIFNYEGTRLYTYDFFESTQFQLQTGGIKESASNMGSLEGSITILLEGETFVNPDERLVENFHYSIVGTPLGTSPVLTVASDGLSALLTFEGNATQHTNFQSILNLGITFTNEAFTGGDASVVKNAVNATMDLGIDFIEAPTVSDLTFSIEENTEVNTTLGTLEASDADYDRLSFQLTTETEMLGFSVDENSGEIMVANSDLLDFEDNPTVSLVVEVTDEDNLQASAQVTVNLTNVNEPPTLADQVVQINENPLNGSAVIQLAATDPESDPLLYSIANADTPEFSIDAETGLLTISDSTTFDVESFSPVRRITVEVTDGVFIAEAEVEVQIFNINEAPLINNRAFSIPENSPEGTEIGIFSTTDPESDEITYSLVSGDESFSIDSQIGLITVTDAGILDFEQNASIVLPVEASDGQLSSVSMVTIDLVNRNEPPVVTLSSFEFAENQPNGTVIGQLTGEDEDGQVPRYALVNVTSVVEVSTAGLVTLRDSSQFDFEARTSLSFDAVVTDGAFEVPFLIEIALTDVNEPPSVSTTSIFVDENSVNGFVIDEVLFADPEDDVITVTIEQESSPEVFDIEEGKLVVVDSSFLDFEANQGIELVLKATDGEFEILSDLSVELVDVNEAPVIIDQVFELSENSANGTLVGQVMASDPENDALVYTLAGSEANAFSISTSGELSVSNSDLLDFEVNNAPILSVAVSDSEFTAEASVVINLTEVILALDGRLSLAFYPNPVTDALKITGFEKIPEQVSVFRLDGVEVDAPIKKSNEVIMIDTSQLSSGVYLIRLNSKEVNSFTFLKR